MTFQLPPLPFPKDSMAPFLTAETFDFHHGKHHKAYVDKLNKLVEGKPEAQKSLEELIKTSQGGLFNNAAQTWNHTFFWSCMSPEGGKLGSGIEGALKKSFGSLDAFKEQFKEQATTLFGSGWVWLVRKDGGGLEIVQGKDADNPLRQGRQPVLTLDVWEHAYYIDYRNDRGKFVDAFWKAVNWGFVEENLERKA